MDRSSDTAPARPPVALIRRNDELEEFVTLLQALGVEASVHSGALPTSEGLAGTRLVIASGKQLLQSGRPDLSGWPRTLAVVDGASKTMVAHLTRLGVSTVVRRPIHPRTLRLLVLHALYRGPERRQRRRSSIGHPIRIGGGLFKQRAVLLELSVSGARVELAPVPQIGSQLKLCLGRELTHGRPLRLQAKVMRIEKTPEAQGGRGVVGVRLLDASTHHAALASLLERFASGPASWSGAPQAEDPTVAEQMLPTPAIPEQAEPTHAAGIAEQTEPTHAPGVAEQAEPTHATGVAEQAEPTHAPPGMAEQTEPTHAPPGMAEQKEPTHAPPGMAEQTEPTHQEASSPLEPPMEEIDPEASASRLPRMRSVEQIARERRATARIPYDRRIVALGNEAARVLIGRDLSTGGMRVVESEQIALGDVLRVALHCGEQMEPLVVLARAVRDDGDEGLLLRFDPLSSGQRDHLEKIIAGCGPIARIEGHSEDRIVVGEMLETVSQAPDADAPIDTGGKDAPA